MVDGTETTGGDVMKVDFIDDAKAPQAPKPLSKTAQESLNILRQLQAKPGKTARITLDPGKEPSGIKRSLGRIASTQKIKIKSWDVDGVVYVRLDDSQESSDGPTESEEQEATDAEGEVTAEEGK